MMPPTDLDAVDLVGAARDLVTQDDPITAGLWPRAAAFLGRQALELALVRLWQLRGAGVETTSLRCQLLCLAPILGDHQLAGRTTAAWAALSRACHYRAYDLPPTAPELLGWLDAVWDLANAVERLQRAAGCPPCRV